MIKSIFTSILLFIFLYSNAQEFKRNSQSNNFSFEASLGYTNLENGFELNNGLEKIVQPSFGLYYKLFGLKNSSIIVGAKLALKGSDIKFTYVNVSTKSIVENNDNRLVRTQYLETPIIIYRSIPKFNINLGIGLYPSYLLTGTKFNRTVDTLNNIIIHTKHDVNDNDNSPFSKTKLNRLDFLIAFRLMYKPQFSESISIGLEYNRSLIELFEYYNYYNSSLSICLNYRLNKLF